MVRYVDLATSLSAILSCTDNKAGITSNTNTVENIKPNEIDIAIGIKNCACIDVSNNSGVRPAMVVNDVSNTARKRWVAALIIACVVAMPASR